jgi:DNA repair photolyase
MACGRYDKLETGAPTFEERLKAAKILSKNVTRVIARIQPYFIDCKRDIIKELPRYKDAGIYGIIVEGYKSKKKQKGMIKDGSRYRFPLEVLISHCKQIREKAHENGLKFWSADDGADCLSDDMECCGTGGLDKFIPNKYTMSYLAYMPEIAKPTKAMQEKGTTRPFRSIRQSQAWELHIKGKSFVDMMQELDNGYVEWLRDTKEKYG